MDYREWQWDAELYLPDGMTLLEDLLKTNESVYHKHVAGVQILCREKRQEIIRAWNECYQKWIREHSGCDREVVRAAVVDQIKKKLADNAEAARFVFGNERSLADERAKKIRLFCDTMHDGDGQGIND